MTRSFIVVAIAVAAACSSTPFSESQVLGGEEVSAAQLNAGHEVYQFYCVACHGADGDGRGPASADLRTPPRDFRFATFKFGGVVNGELPRDEDLERIVLSGLAGTAMLEWHLPETLVGDVVQYVKSFSAAEVGWRDPDNAVGEPVVTTGDPWQPDRAEQAIERGRAVYHGLATCQQCHPAYEPAGEIRAHLRAFEKPDAPPRERFWLSLPRMSAVFSRPIVGDPACEAASECGDGDGFICRFGRCERKLVITPPDFTFNEIRTGRELEGLFRIIGSGIPGTAMPPWKDALPDEDIWAMAHYVEHLSAMRGTPEASALEERVKSP